MKTKIATMTLIIICIVTGILSIKFYILSDKPVKLAIMINTLTFVIYGVLIAYICHLSTNKKHLRKIILIIFVVIVALILMINVYRKYDIFEDPGTLLLLIQLITIFIVGPFGMLFLEIGNIISNGAVGQSFWGASVFMILPYGILLILAIVLTTEKRVIK